MSTRYSARAHSRGHAAVMAHDPSLLDRFLGLALLAVVIGGLWANQSWAAASVASAARLVHAQASALAYPRAEPVLTVAPSPAPQIGVDVDGDGRGDFMNPTGRPERTHDHYGFGAFGVSRGGGERVHEGVDYASIIGQAVVAPMSGFVARVGYAYSDDPSLRTVEIVNPALHYVARVLYVSPEVVVGQAVAMGEVIGKAQSLQTRYPDGMTNHVHLQISPQGKGWIDCERLIPSYRG